MILPAGPRLLSTKPAALITKSSGAWLELFETSAITVNNLQIHSGATATTITLIWRTTVCENTTEVSWHQSVSMCRACKAALLSH